MEIFIVVPEHMKFETNNIDLDHYQCEKFNDENEALKYAQKTAVNERENHLIYKIQLHKKVTLDITPVVTDVTE